jgi:hypothetical protein
MKEHKHAEVLRAIADGKEVEYWYEDEWQQDSSTNPITNGHLAWRIKPEPKPPIVEDKHVYFSDMAKVVYFIDSAIPNKSFVPNIRFTFDPDTKLPIKVELI